MNRPHIFNIQMIAPGIELVLEALSELPMKRSQPLYNEIATQYATQLQQLRKAAEQPAEETPNPQLEESQS